jgi:hypothetical protein
MWRDEASMAGVLRVEAGHRLGAHAHRVNHHHIWVVDGHAAIVGTDVGPGSYVHIPSGVVHDIDAAATEGCTISYLYLRPAGSGRQEPVSRVGAGIAWAGRMGGIARPGSAARLPVPGAPGACGPGRLALPVYRARRRPQS